MQVNTSGGGNCANNTSSKLTTLSGAMITNHNLQKITRSVAPSSFDPTQFKGVTDNAGGVFGMAKREVTEFDLKLVYKH